MKLKKKNLSLPASGLTMWNQTNWKKACTNCRRGEESRGDDARDFCWETLSDGLPLWFPASQWRPPQPRARVGRGHSRVRWAAIAEVLYRLWEGEGGGRGGGVGSWSSLRHCVSSIDLIEPGFLNRVPRGGGTPSHQVGVPGGKEPGLLGRGPPRSSRSEEPR